MLSMTTPREVLWITSMPSRPLRTTMATWKTGPAGLRLKKMRSPGTRLLLFSGSGSPYPVYKTIENAQRFTLKELTGILKKLYEADWRVKSGGKHPEVLLGNLIIRICQPEKAEER